MSRKIFEEGKEEWEKLPSEAKVGLVSLALEYGLSQLDLWFESEFLDEKAKEFLEKIEERS